MTEEIDSTFASMGSQVRLLIGSPSNAAREGTPAEAAARERAFVEDRAARLSRFRPDSELSRLNDDPRFAVPASSVLCAAVAAAVWAAAITDGLVDPTLLDATERSGYRQSLTDATPASLREALRAAPARTPARPHGDAAWTSIGVDRERGVINRPPGLRIDTGGTAKGLIADAVASRLRGFSRFVVDCGGDIVVGGDEIASRPYEIQVAHPLTGACAHVLRSSGGGVATSGLNVRIWRHRDGTFAHHLLDPSTGEPAWTGLIAATALGSSALEAEALAKQALLWGPRGARRVLRERGGVTVHDDGEVEVIGAARQRPRVRLRLPESSPA